MSADFALLVVMSGTFVAIWFLIGRIMVTRRS